MAVLQLVINALKAKSGAADFEKSTKKVQGSATTATRATDKFDKSIDKVGKTSSKVGVAFKSLFAGFGAALVLRDSIRTISDFGSTMSTVQAVTGASAQQFENLRQTAIDLGAATRFSATEAGEGLTFLARAGFTVNDAIEAVPHALNLAAAGAIELGEAADVASNVLSQFQMSTSQSEEVVDALVHISNSANTNVRQLAEALTYAGQTASSFGLDVHETAAALGVMGDFGLQASMAGTGLRMALAKLVDMTDEAKDTIKDLGINLEDIDLKTHSATEIFGKFGEAGLGAEEALKIFGIRAANAAVAMSLSTDKMEKLTNESRKMSGVAERAAKIMDDNLAGSFKALRSAVETAFIATGDAGFAGGLRTVIDVATGVIRALAGMEEKVEKYRGTALFLAEAIKAVTASLAAMVAIKSVVFFTNLAKSIWLSVTAMLSFNKAMLANPFGLISKGIIVAVGAITYFKDQLITIGDTTATVGDFIVTAFNHVKDNLRVIITAIAMGFSKAWDDLKNKAKYAFELVATNFSELGKNLDINWSRAIGVVLDTLQAFANAAIGVFVGLGDTIYLSIRRIVEFGTALGNIDVTDIAGGFGFGKVIDQMKSALSPTQAINELKSSWSEALDKDYVDLLAAKGEEGFKALKASFSDAVKGGGGPGSLMAGMFAIPDVSGLFNISAVMDEISSKAELRAKIRAKEREKRMRDDALAAEELQKKMNDALSGKDIDTSKQSKYDEIIEKVNKIEENSKNAGKELTNTFKSVGESIGSSIGDALESAIFEGEKFRDIMKALFEDVAKAAFRAFVTQQLISAAGTLAGGGKVPAAKGLVFEHGNITPFAGGGIVDKPTVFSFAQGGRIGMMGETGPEAILPLERTSGGKLGVKAESTVAPQRITNVTMNISTPDTDGFRRSSNQLIMDVKQKMKD